MGTLGLRPTLSSYGASPAKLFVKYIGSRHQPPRDQKLVAEPGNGGSRGQGLGKMLILAVRTVLGLDGATCR
jgi:hypothetical protein